MEGGQQKVNIELSEHFTYRKLLKFTFPSIIMMVLASVYGVVDGFFISNYIGADEVMRTDCRISLWSRQ